MSNQIIKCAKCQNNAETEPRWDEFTHTYAIRDKDGQIYCWDCYKGISHCEGCQKSVANLKFPKSGNPYYPHAGGYSVGCERIENEVKFICSKECSKKLADQRYQAWKDKLSQGWTKCEACIKFWIDGESNEEGWEWLKEERQHSRFIKLLPPGEKGACDRCKPYEKDGYYHKIHQQAQKYWDSLSPSRKLAEVIRTDAVHMAKFYGETLTAEQLAEQKKVPRSIYEDFVHNQKCGGCGEEPCQENKRNKNNSQCPQLACSSSEETNKEELEKKLIEAKKQGADKKEIERLQSELEKLSNRQQREEVKPTKDNNGLIWGLGILVVIGLSLGTAILINKKKK